MSAENSQREQRERLITAALLRTVKETIPKNSAMGILGAFLIALVSVLSNWQGSLPLAPCVWFAIAATLMLYGIVVARKENRTVLDGVEVSRIERMLPLQAAVGGLLWGSASWFLLPMAIM